MKNLLQMTLVLLLVAALVGTSYGEGDEVQKLVESKEFWSSYQWGKLEDSAFYKTGSFELTQSFFENKYDFYESDLKIDALSTKFKIKTDGDSRIDMYFVYLTNPPLADFDRLLQWCRKHYGNAYNNYENRKISTGDTLLINRELTWRTDNTAIQLFVSYATKKKASKPEDKPKVDFVYLVYKSMPTAVINKPVTSLSCSMNIDDKTAGAVKLDEISLNIDENSGEVTTPDDVVTGWQLKVSDKFYDLNKRDADKNVIHLTINRKSWKLQGSSKIARTKDSLKLKGICKKIDSGRKKN